MSDESIARALNMKPLEETDAKKVKKTIPQVVEGEMVDDVKNLPQESVFQPPVPIEKLADENLADIELAKKNIDFSAQLVGISIFNDRYLHYTRL